MAELTVHSHFRLPIRPIPGRDLPRTHGDDDTTEAKPRRFHGSIGLDPIRTGSDAGRIAEEVIAHLAGLAGADVNVTLEISVDVPDGVLEQVVRIVTENCRTLKFESYGFDNELSMRRATS